MYIYSVLNIGKPAQRAKPEWQGLRVGYHPGDKATPERLSISRVGHEPTVTEMYHIRQTLQHAVWVLRWQRVVVKQSELLTLPYHQRPKGQYVYRLTWTQEETA